MRSGELLFSSEVMEFGCLAHPGRMWDTVIPAHRQHPCFFYFPFPLLTWTKAWELITKTSINKCQVHTIRSDEREVGRRVTTLWKPCMDMMFYLFSMCFYTRNFILSWQPTCKVGRMNTIIPTFQIQKLKEVSCLAPSHTAGWNHRIEKETRGHLS